MTDKKTKRQSDLICIWCGKSTTGSKAVDSEEHIFPESIGGKDTLPIGDVCRECPNKLSKLDKVLRYGHPAMMLAYQKDPSIKGKKTSKKSVKQRRQEEKFLIRGQDGKATVKTDYETTKTTFTDISYDFQDDFSRAIHKCIANVICSEHGSKYVRENYNELIDFVKNGINPYAWSYVVSFANPFKNLFCEPKCIKLGYMSIVGIKGDLLVIICFIHTSGIWVATAKPNYLNKNIIEAISESILKKTPFVKKIQEQDYDIEKLYGMKWVKDREYIGQLKFLWVKKQVNGKPNPEDAFYLLTKCKLCGQVNPTGIMVSKEILFGEDQVPMVAIINSSFMEMGPLNVEYKAEDKCLRFVRMPKNNWNRYSISDLHKKGLTIEKWKSESLQQYIDTQGIEIPQEKDIRKWNISNCSIQCLNCGNIITYSAEDCFL